MERKETLIKKKYIEYFISTLAMSGSTAITSIVDMIMVGNIVGSNAMAAIGLTAPIIFIINVIFDCIYMAGIRFQSHIKAAEIRRVPINALQ